MAAPRIHATSVSLSTHDPRALAAFYSQLLGVEVAAAEGPREGEPPTAGWAQLQPVAGRLMMTLNFEWDPHYTPPVWPTPAPDRLGWPGLGAAGTVETVPGAAREVGHTPSVGVAAQQVMAHLDLQVDDLAAAEAWALSCGATRHTHQPQPDVRVLLDPHGHPFCLCAEG